MQPSNTYYSSSPTVVLPMPQQAGYFGSSHYVTNDNVQMTNGFSDPFGQSSNTSAPMTPSVGSIAGRKRSRGDILAPEDEHSRDEDGSVPTPASELPSGLLPAPQFGPGMTVIQPNVPGFQSQSGSWSDRHQTSDMSNDRRPPVTSRKSQRVDSSVSGSDDLAHLVLPSSMREVTQEPLIDEATRTLGISWTRMDISEARLINQAAYSKWIQNHYPRLNNVAVWFENSAIPCYLVCARNVYSGATEYYLFSNDLTEARLITTEPSQLLTRLQALPALHLAAPGGCIRAETDPISADQNALNEVQATMINGKDEATPDAELYDEPQGMCAAHSMEMD